LSTMILVRFWKSFPTLSNETSLNMSVFLFTEVEILSFWTANYFNSNLYIITPRLSVCLSVRPDVPLFLGKYLTPVNETWHEPLLWQGAAN
jgi:hypothetical protein